MKTFEEMAKDCCKIRDFGGRMNKKIYDYTFSELFESERDAVVSFLSLERRYMDLMDQYKKLSEEYDNDQKG